jgi:hypothetical protein
MYQNNQAAGGANLGRRDVRRRGALCMALRLPCAGRHARAEGPVTGCNLPAKPLPQAVLEFYRQSGVGALCTATIERIARIEPITVTYEDGVFVLGYRATGRRGASPNEPMGSDRNFGP